MYSAEAEETLTDFQRLLKNVLKQNLLGLYAYGSFATGDFSELASDLDLLAVTESEINDEEFEKLKKLHLAFGTSHPRWKDRVDIAYVSRAALKGFKTTTSTAVTKSGQYPLQLTHSAPHWLIDWYKTQETGITLYGPSPSHFIPAISVDEFTHVVREYMKKCKIDVTKSTTHGSQASVVLAVCRSLYAVRHGVHVSKKLGATWVSKTYPKYAGLVNRSLQWSRNSQQDLIEDLDNQAEVSGFIDLAIKEAETYTV